MEWFAAGDYELARQVLQRGIAALYLIAFVSAAYQFPALLGDRGLLPAQWFMNRISFRQSPSLFHWRYSDNLLLGVASAGAGAAATLVVGIPQSGPPWLPMIIFLALWAAYLSIVNIGQTFYAFGWESLLLEAGFIVAFLGSDEVAPPLLVLFFLRWLVFRLEFGAGMIKMRGGREWRDFTALYYHHETQPMPNPLSWYVHHLPRWFHRGEVLGSHVAQLVVPFFLFAPQPVASVAALIIVLTQLWLVATGNFAWLNWITIVLAFAAIDDETVRALIPAFGFTTDFATHPAVVRRARARGHGIPARSQLASARQPVRQAPADEREFQPVPPGQRLRRIRNGHEGPDRGHRRGMLRSTTGAGQRVACL